MRPSTRLAAGLAALAAQVLGLGLAPSCASQSVEVEWEEVDSPHYVSEDGRFALELPLGWLRSGRVLARAPKGEHSITFNAGPVLMGEEALGVDASAPQLM
jgi:hypothetical protein